MKPHKEITGNLQKMVLVAKGKANKPSRVKSRESLSRLRAFGGGTIVLQLPGVCGLPLARLAISDSSKSVP